MLTCCNSLLKHPITDTFDSTCCCNNKKKKLRAVIININSEAVSRRLPTEKAIRIINTLRRKKIPQQIILMGSNKEKAPFVDSVYNALNR